MRLHTYKHEVYYWELAIIRVVIGGARIKSYNNDKKD